MTLSGAEGVGSDYSRPTVDELSYYNSKGVKLIRLEVRWDKLQPELGGLLDEDELKWVEVFVNQANQQKMQVIIDLHQRSTYNDLNFGNTGINPDDLANFWKKFAGRLIQDNIPGICGFGMANEPNNVPGFLGIWPKQVNPVIKVISSVDHAHLIFVPEDNWILAAVGMQIRQHKSKIRRHTKLFSNPILTGTKTPRGSMILIFHRQTQLRLKIWS